MELATRRGPLTALAQITVLVRVAACRQPTHNTCLSDSFEARSPVYGWRQERWMVLDDRCDVGMASSLRRETPVRRRRCGSVCSGTYVARSIWRFSQSESQVRAVRPVLSTTRWL